MLNRKARIEARPAMLSAETAVHISVIVHQVLEDLSLWSQASGSRRCSGLVLYIL